MSRTARRVLAAAIIVLILGCVGALIKPRTDTDLREQAVAEMTDLAPPEWDVSAPTVDGPAGARHTSITWRLHEPPTVADAVQRAKDEGWAPRQCGDQVCLDKGQYFLHFEPIECPPGQTGCGLAVTISWTRPLAAWRALALVVTLVVVAVGLCLLVGRARARDNARDGV
ncbi:hypothetical protein Lfu02_14940 [Longispora fulva]|uniref:Uncharacterized protein n=1 Tax=Longispora fulva TaxID=619741 RepID=A0A8J7KNQ1_9ACTN|nr:hypothetical protein [Longispora fulva]MBG6140496.1 hypothetical protein [Longispora fulva]GIG57122.1 hypothetical protein Lfu02_14940 [Longispora fulva]